MRSTRFNSIAATSLEAVASDFLGEGAREGLDGTDTPSLMVLDRFLVRMGAGAGVTETTGSAKASWTRSVTGNGITEGTEGDMVGDGGEGEREGVCAVLTTMVGRRGLMFSDFGALLLRLPLPRPAALWFEVERVRVGG